MPARRRTPKSDAKKVARVIMRLTRASVTLDEVRVLCALHPGKHARWLPSDARRFLRDLLERVVLNGRDETHLSYAQRRWLWSLAVAHREKLNPDLRDVASQQLHAHPRLPRDEAT